MASYHFKIKTDIRPNGTKVSAAAHADYNGREGRFENIDQEREQQSMGFTGNMIGVAAESNGSQSLLYQSKEGSLCDNGKAIETSDNASIEVLQVALTLAANKYGTELNVEGSEQYKAQVIVAAVEMKLPICFADKNMEEARIKLQEERENERKQFAKRGEQIEPGKRYGKPNIAGIGQNPPPQRRHHLQTLSQLDVVCDEEGSKLLLQGNVSNSLDNQKAGEHSPLRRDLSGTRRRLAEIKAKEITDRVSAAAHTDYIEREGSFEYKGGCVHKAQHLPKWAEGSAKKFFTEADKYEDAKSTRYREIEFALPNELKLEQQIELVNNFVKMHLGEDFYWSLAIHSKKAAMGEGAENPHVHIMFSERKIDDIERTNERSPEVFFKKANRTYRERGGCKKDPRWNGQERFRHLVTMRKDYALLQNQALEKYGFDVRVDHRSLVAQCAEAIKKGDHVLAQILSRKPEENVGPKHVYNFESEKVISLKQFRQIKNENIYLIKAANVLERSIADQAREESVQESIAQANLFMSDFSGNQVQTTELQNLSNQIIQLSREIEVVKDMVVTEKDAIAMARRSLMTVGELQIEAETKVIVQEKLELKRLEKELKKPDGTNLTDIELYRTAKEQIAQRLNQCDIRANEFGQQLRMVNSRFLTQDSKVKLEKAKKEILLENQEAKSMLLELQGKLNTITETAKALLRQEIKNKLTTLDANIEQVLADAMAEKVLLSNERKTLTDQQEAFAKKAEPNILFTSAYTEWAKEKEQLQHAGIALLEKERANENCIATLREEIASVNSKSNEQEQTGKETNLPEELAKTIQITAAQARAAIEYEISSIRASLRTVENELVTMTAQVISEVKAQAMAKGLVLKSVVGAKYDEIKNEASQIKKEQARITAAKEQLSQKTKEFTALNKPGLLASAAVKEDYQKLKQEIQESNGDIVSRQDVLRERITKYEQAMEKIQALTTKPEVQEKIQARYLAIMGKNQSVTRSVEELTGKKNSLSAELKELTGMKTTLDKKVRVDVAAARKTGSESQYRVSVDGKGKATPSTGKGAGGGGGGSSSKQNEQTNAAKVLASILRDDPKLVALTARSEKEQIDFAAMSPEEIEMALAKIEREQER